MDNDIMLSLVKEFLTNGESKLYNNLLSQSVKQIILLINEGRKTYPDKTLLAMSNKFLNQYRASGDDSYLKISKILRRAAHKIYRVLLKKKLVGKNNDFLNLV